MVYSSKVFESLWFLYQAEGLPKNISIEEFFASKAAKPSAAQSTEFLRPFGSKRAELERTIPLSTNGTGILIRKSIRLHDAGAR